MNQFNSFKIQNSFIQNSTMRYATTLTLIFALSQCLYAQHTFSIVAVDTMTNEVGSAGATCLSAVPEQPA